MSELEGKTLDELRKLARERGLIKGMAVYQYSKAEIAEGLIDGTMPNKQTTQRDGINLTDASYLRRIEFAILEKLLNKGALGGYGVAGEYYGESGSTTFGRMHNEDYCSLDEAKKQIEKLIKER